MAITLIEKKFPINFWASRYKDGHIILTINKPVRRGDYWVDDQGPTIPIPSNYFPDVTFTGGPKLKTFESKSEITSKKELHQKIREIKNSI